jgi:hypothetical protein
LFTNYCEGLDQQHKQVTCQLWDREFESPDARSTEGSAEGSTGGSIARSHDGKRRLTPPPWER